MSKVEELMRTRGLVSVAADDDVEVAAGLMRAAEARHLPVVDDDRRVVGMLVERDLARAGGRPARVHEVMSRPVETVTPDEPLAAACALMIARDVGCLPVVDEGGRLVGVLTRADLLGRELAAELTGPTPDSAGVSAAMSRQPAVVQPWAPLLEAVALMVDWGVRHVPVVDEQRRVLGMLSDRDVRTAIGDPLEALRLELDELEQMKVSGVMSTDVVTIREDAPLAEAARLLAEEAVGALPVVDARERLVGIVSYVDIIRALLGERPRALRGAAAAEARATT